MTYGERIKKLREAKGIKAIYVAERLGLSPAGYSGIEKGKSKLSAERAAEIAKILEVPITRIFFDDEISVTLTSNVG